MWLRSVIYILALFISFTQSDSKVKFYEAKDYHGAQELSDRQLQKLSALNDNGHIEAVLDEILIPRVVGTPGHEKVGNYITIQLRQLNWNVEENIFEDNTPVFGKLKFRNLVAKHNPNAERFLFLACHYDSKYTREYDFVGATDSAVPCAMLLNLAKTMQHELNSVKHNNNVSLGFIFFDGEEAFRTWGPNDSIYGARHLAKKWQHQLYPARNRDGTNNLHRMDMLVLLDLLGTPNPSFFSYFPKTEKWYVRLASAEGRLNSLGLLNRSSRKSGQNYFKLKNSYSYIEDDHIPFMKRDVDIMHIIPQPFPDVWHTEADNREAIDMSTIENLNKIFRVFVTEYLHLTVDQDLWFQDRGEQTAGRMLNTYAIACGPRPGYTF